mmetsp:Transcript_27199/g.63323  ORF Transcript_27199/g.63323 Transcript_27199/m.63323 type:complete len:247 (+) Transcript_27199:1516-2256(+)
MGSRAACRLLCCCTCCFCLPSVTTLSSMLPFRSCNRALSTAWRCALSCNVSLSRHSCKPSTFAVSNPTRWPQERFSLCLASRSACSFTFKSPMASSAACFFSLCFPRNWTHLVVASATAVCISPRKGAVSSTISCRRSCTSRWSLPQSCVRLATLACTRLCFSNSDMCTFLCAASTCSLANSAWRCASLRAVSRSRSCFRSIWSIRSSSLTRCSVSCSISAVCVRICSTRRLLASFTVLNVSTSSP